MDKKELEKVIERSLHWNFEEYIDWLRTTGGDHLAEIFNTPESRAFYEERRMQVRSKNRDDSPEVKYNKMLQVQIAASRAAGWRWSKKLFVVLLFVVVLTYFMNDQSLHESKDTIIFEFIVYLILALIALFGGSHSWLSKGYYHAIPGAVDQNGNHRCIWCGARGIWRKTEYKTENVFCRCSKCHGKLWME
jgi:hypothetical protein